MLIKILSVFLFVLIGYLIVDLSYQTGFKDGNKAADRWFADALNQESVAKDRYNLNTESCSPGKWITHPTMIGGSLFFPPGTWRNKRPITWEEAKDPANWENLGEEKNE